MRQPELMLMQSILVAVEGAQSAALSWGHICSRSTVALVGSSRSSLHGKALRKQRSISSSLGTWSGRSRQELQVDPGSISRACSSSSSVQEGRSKTANNYLRLCRCSRSSLLWRAVNQQPCRGHTSATLPRTAPVVGTRGA